MNATRHSLLPLAASIAMTLTACGGLSQRDRDLLHSGQTAAEEHRWSRAMAVFTDLLESRPDFTLARYYRGEAAHRLGRHQEAIVDLEFAAEDRNILPSQRARAFYLAALSQVSLGRAALSDEAFRSGEGTLQERREARTRFLAASVSLQSAERLPSEAEDVTAWRAYTLYRLENYRKALDLGQQDRDPRSAHWRMRLVRALALEGLHGPNEKSLELVLELAMEKPTAERLDVYRYLVDVHDEAPRATQSRIPPLVAEFRRSTGSQAPEITAFLARIDELREAERRAILVRETVARARELSEAERFREAIDLLRGHAEAEGADPALSAAVDRTVEGWAKLLALRSSTLLERGGDRRQIEQVIEEYQHARQATDRLELKITFQQQISDLQLAHAQLTSSRRLREIAALQQKSKHSEAVSALRALDLRDLDEADRDLYHYLLAASLFELKDWRQVVSATESLGKRNFDDVDYLEGMARVRLGQVSRGIAILDRLPPGGGDDDTRRLLGRHHLEEGDEARAILYLDRLEKPTTEDLDMAVRCRTRLGVDAFERSEYPAAIEHLEIARRILDEKLRRPGSTVYTYLGNCYFRVENFPRARKIYSDLIHSDLTEDERLRSREAYFNLARIRLREKRDDLAYQTLQSFLRFGSSLPEDLLEEYGRTAATFADYAPLDRVHYWNYTSALPGQEYNQTVTVDGREDGAYVVERRESGRLQKEVWRRDGIFLVQETGPNGGIELRLPTNLDPVQQTLPHEEYTTGENGRFRFRSEVVATNQTVTLPDGREYRGCLEVKLTRTIGLPSGRTQRTRHILWLAPDVGEVRRETYQNDKKVADLVLSEVVLRKEPLPAS